jgi:hypothetical protein
MEMKRRRRTAVILLESQLFDRMRCAWENAYIEGYLALTLYVIKQVVHDRKKNHIPVSVVALGCLLWDKEVAQTFSALVVHRAGIAISTLVARSTEIWTHLW